MLYWSEYLKGNKMTIANKRSMMKGMCAAQLKDGKAAEDML